MSRPPVYSASRIKRRRPTKAEVEQLKVAIEDFLLQRHPCTNRQVYYRLVSQGLIEKTENQYDAVCRLLKIMRVQEGRIPFEWIADHSRWMRKPSSHSCIEEALRETAETYRRDLWQSQDVYLEVWLEKDALAGAVFEVTSQWDVPLMVTRGEPSITFLHQATQWMQAQQRPAFVYILTDHDPGGPARLADRKDEAEGDRVAMAEELTTIEQESESGHIQVLAQQMARAHQRAVDGQVRHFGKSAEEALSMR